MARKPRIADAEGWRKSVFDDDYENVTIEIPTGLTVSDAETKKEKRFSYVSADIVLRNWYRLRADGIKTKYYYGERAQNEVLAEAHSLDWKIECDKNGW
jgi:hypothetical protein